MRGVASPSGEDPVAFLSLYKYTMLYVLLFLVPLLMFLLPIIVYIHRFTRNACRDFAMLSRGEVVVRYSQDPLHCLEGILSNLYVRSAAWTVHGKVAVHLVGETL